MLGRTPRFEVIIDCSEPLNQREGRGVYIAGDRLEGRVHIPKAEHVQISSVQVTFEGQIRTWMMSLARPGEIRTMQHKGSHLKGTRVSSGDRR